MKVDISETKLNKKNDVIIKIDTNFLKFDTCYWIIHIIVLNLHIFCVEVDRICGCQFLPPILCHIEYNMCQFWHIRFYSVFDIIVPGIFFIQIVLCLLNLNQIPNKISIFKSVNIPSSKPCFILKRFLIDVGLWTET